MLINFTVNKTKDKEGSCEIEDEAEKKGDEVGIWPGLGIRKRERRNAGK